jgi:hypothetical protein
VLWPQFEDRRASIRLYAILRLRRIGRVGASVVGVRPTTTRGIDYGNVSKETASQVQEFGPVTDRCEEMDGYAVLVAGPTSTLEQNYCSSARPRSSSRPEQGIG